MGKNAEEINTPKRPRGSSIWIRATVSIDPELWKSSQDKAIKGGMSMSGLVAKLLRDWRGTSE